MNDFPVLDSLRTVSNEELDRIIVDEYGSITPYVEEMDWCCEMPLRLMHDQASDVCIEVGPYTLDHRDVDRLRAAIRGYDNVVRRSI